VLGLVPMTRLAVFAMKINIKSINPVNKVLFGSIRPSIDDVERISKGLAAKRRGTGSRAVPHRLNEAERKEWVIFYFQLVFICHVW